MFITHQNFHCCTCLTTFHKCLTNGPLELFVSFYRTAPWAFPFRILYDLFTLYFHLPTVQIRDSALPFCFQELVANLMSIVALRSRRLRVFFYRGLHDTSFAFNCKGSRPTHLTMWSTWNQRYKTVFCRKWYCYKGSTIINYSSGVVIWGIFKSGTALES